MSSPIRVSDDLMEDAKVQTIVSLRSIAKQIEFWANIGKEVEVNMTPADIAALISGEIEINILRKESEPVDFETVFAEIESDRKQGIIASKVIRDKIWYEENHDKVGTFYRVTSDGQRTLGEFIDGKFVAKVR